MELQNWMHVLFCYFAGDDVIRSRWRL